MVWQSYTYPPAHRPLQTRPGLRPDNPPRQPPYHNTLYPLSPLEPLLVDDPVRVRGAHGLARHVGLPMARIEAHVLWREGQGACGAWK